MGLTTIMGILAMALREKLYTVEEFWEIARLPENEGRRLELENGVIVEMASSTPLNTVTAGRIIYFLNAFVIPNNLGYVTVPDGGFALSHSSKVRQPDAAFISKERISELPDQFQLAPDLAVEIVSENEDVLKKVNEYLLSGSRIVWAVYAEEKIVYVFHLDEDSQLIGQTFSVDDTLNGGDVLPGFTLPVRDIFPA
jgi:Uma2 family endonuclease